MKKLSISIFCIALFIPTYSLALDLSSIIQIIANLYGVNLDIKNLDDLSLEKLDELKDGLTGTHNYGNNNYDPNIFVWGDNTDNWQSIINLTSTQRAEGDLGRMINDLVKQFPIAKSEVSTNDLENQYYLIQAQTTLAARASSQVAFKQINNEARTMHKLHQLIDQTKDNKSAVDLSNRLASEQANINIQQAKLLAVLVEQAAISNQEKSNHAKENAEFFDTK